MALVHRQRDAQVTDVSLRDVGAGRDGPDQECLRVAPHRPGDLGADVGGAAGKRLLGRDLDALLRRQLLELDQASLAKRIVEPQPRHAADAAPAHVVRDHPDHQAIGLRCLEDPPALVHRLDDGDRRGQRDIRHTVGLQRLEDSQAGGAGGAAHDGDDAVFLDQPFGRDDRFRGIALPISHHVLDAHRPVGTLCRPQIVLVE